LTVGPVVRLWPPTPARANRFLGPRYTTSLRNSLDVEAVDFDNVQEAGRDAPRTLRLIGRCGASRFQVACEFRAWAPGDCGLGERRLRERSEKYSQSGNGDATLLHPSRDIVHEWSPLLIPRRRSRPKVGAKAAVLVAKSVATSILRPRPEDDGERADAAFVPSSASYLSLAVGNAPIRLTSSVFQAPPCHDRDRTSYG
jgi:hypothetical protein